MIIYIAAPWKDREKMPAIAAQFEAAGNQITHRWWDIEVERLAVVEADPILLSQQAMADVKGVQEAQLLVLLNTGTSEGKSLEQGIAIDQGKPILAVGTLGEHSKNVFHYLSNYLWVGTVEEAIQVLNHINWLFRGASNAR